MTAKKAASTAGKKGGARQRTSVSDTKTGTQPPRRSVEEHSEHPESAGDSTVRHADSAVGRASAGKKGFPQGEYDVDQPAKRGAVRKDPTQLAIEQGLDDEQLRTIKAAIAHPKANRLKAEQRALAIEALPEGTVIEKEGRFRWRVRSAGTNGGNRFGHGTTAQEAIDNYILGSSALTGDAAGAERFQSYPKSVQQEIEDRDAAVAKRQGVSPESFPEVIARREFQENQKAGAKAAHPAPGAVTDGAEQASAQLEAGARRGRGEANEARKTATANRSAARRRSGGKARK